MELQIKGAGIPIKEILPHCQIFGAANVEITSCSHDWNQIQPGDLYVAKAGMEKDGHETKNHQTK